MDTPTETTHGTGLAADAFTRKALGEKIAGLKHQLKAAQVELDALTRYDRLVDTEPQAHD